ncbi:cryptochrome/photolyase family protein [Chitinophagaceae bacterium MMS25-I14]
MKDKVSIFWFRRDLRLKDNAGLYHALKSGYPVVPVFIFDTNILDELEDKADKRVNFIHQTITGIQKQLAEKGSSLHVFHATPEHAFEKIREVYDVAAVFTNNDYEPYATARDKKIAALLLGHGIPFHSYKDQVIFEKDEVVKDDGTPYYVYTPYSKRWKMKLNDFYLRAYPTGKYYRHFYKQKQIAVPSLQQLGFEPAEVHIAVPHLNESIARNYDKTRDYPGIHGTTRMSVHLRFGTISIRQLAADAKSINEKLLNELIWRDFYQMILWHEPRVITQSFKPEYDRIKWRNNEQEFERWCNGQTGYPIVDAGMRELNETGWMHNRVRMIVASFLCKHLLIDWRWGEAYFSIKLLDYDLAANNGGWQWSAGTGVDAAPYFRVFNPYLQTEKFDPDLTYIKKWVPEFQEWSYPKPMVNHEEARLRCLETYKTALNK